MSHRGTGQEPYVGERDAHPAELTAKRYLLSYPTPGQAPPLKLMLMSTRQAQRGVHASLAHGARLTRTGPLFFVAFVGITAVLHPHEG